jgi:hypothetical protein
VPANGGRQPRCAVMTGNAGGKERRHKVAPRLTAAAAASACTPVLGGVVIGTLRAARRGRTRGHTTRGHDGRSAPPPHAAAGHNGPDSARAGTRRPCRWDGRARRAFRPTAARHGRARRAANGTGGHATAAHDGPWLARVRRGGWTRLRPRPAHDRRKRAGRHRPTIKYPELFRPIPCYGAKDRVVPHDTAISKIARRAAVDRA